MVRVRGYELKLGRRTGLAAALALALVAMGLILSPNNLTAGVITGVSGVVGAFLGVLIDVKPVARSNRAEAAGAVRKLNETVRAVEDVQTTLQQLAELQMNVRVSLGIVSAQSDLEGVRTALYESMGEWELVSPGAGDAVKRTRSAGSDMLRKMTEEQGNTS